MRDISVYVGSLNDTNSPTRGDGFNPVVNLYRGEVLLFDVVDEDATDWYVQTAANVYQWGLYNYEGLYFTVRYRSPLFSWRTRSVTYVWDTIARAAGEDLKMLKGKKELDFLESICDRRNLKLDQDPYHQFTLKTGLIIPVDESFSRLIEQHEGLSLAGFHLGGESHEDLGLVLGAFSARFKSNLKVFLVNIADYPDLREEYAIKNFPNFKMFLNGEVIKSYTGAHSYSDLQREFSPLIEENASISRKKRRMSRRRK